MFWITCDVCLEQNDQGHWYAAVARSSAVSEGWIVRSSGAAVCPECQGEPAP